MKLHHRDVRLDPGAITEAGEFEGYGSIFGVRDSYGTKWVRGCFAKSIAEKGARGIKMFLGHDQARPIGAWLDLSEDDKGLKVRGRLLKDDLPSAREAYTLMRNNILDGLSVGFRTRKSRIDTNDGTEVLEDVDLFEISPVMFPSVPGSAISAVRGKLPTEREFETLLTQDAGLTRSQARVVITRGFKALAAKPGAGIEDSQSSHAENAALVAELDRMANIFR